MARKPLLGLPKDAPKLAQPALRMKIARRLVLGRMHDGVIRVNYHDKPVGVRVEMQMSQDGLAAAD
jgi:hypothetical protein